MKVRAVESELFSADGRMDKGHRHDESSSSFHNFVNVSKIIDSIALHSSTYKAAE